MIKKIKDLIQIDSKNTTMLIKEHSGFVELLYYGDKLKNIEGIEFVSRLNRIDCLSSLDDYNTYKTVFSFFGDGNDREPFILLNDGKGNFTSKFEYCYSQIIKSDFHAPTPHINGLETLLLHYDDPVKKIETELFISASEDSDVLLFASKVKNCSDEDIYVKRLMSMQIDLDSDEFEVLSLDGRWSNERKKTVNRENGGIFVIDSKRGASSNKHNPFVLVKDVKRNAFYGINHIYSGNHKFILDIATIGLGRLLAGINDFCFDHKLSKNEELYSSQTTLVFGHTEAEITENYHDFINRRIIPERWRYSERPILLNNWESTYFDFDGEKILSLAKCAKELGMELFVLDDGWFGHDRNHDRASLGDWFDNEKKTGGIGNLSTKIKEYGLKFGIWVEPEMISKDSDLYRSHPEYALALPGTQPIERRNQLVLDITQPEVQAYLIKVLSDLFSLCKPDYVKWDCNRALSELYSPYLFNGNLFYEYMAALYKIMGELTAKYPEILFESCSGGGNRYDLGLMCYMPQVWASDNTDARSRTDIQAGTLFAYPQSTMGAHVSVCPNHQTNNITPLRERFIVACGGLLGYEFDITKLDEQEKEEIKNQVSFYKQHRKLLQYGKYRLIQDDSLYVQALSDENTGETMVTAIKKSERHNIVKEKIYLNGFEDHAVYRVSFYGREETFDISGDLLNHAGLDIDDFFARNNTNAIKAIMMYIVKK